MIVSREYLSPNHSSGWLYGQPKVVVIHSTRSGVNWSHDKEMEATINWFLGTNSNASSNLIISPTEIVRMVPDDKPSWHAKEHSWQAWGIEVTQQTINTPLEDGHYKLLAEALKHYQSLGVQPVWLPSLNWGDTSSGWIQHLETAQGLRDGKSDIGYQLNKNRLSDMMLVEDIVTPEQDAILRDIQDWVKTDIPERLTRLEEAVAVLQTGGVDYDKLAKAVNDEAAKRLKE